MSDINVKDLTTKLLQDTNEHGIRSNSYRFCNLEDIRKNLVGEDNQPVDHDSSILSPAAYFVDLMRLVKNKVSLDDSSSLSLWSRRKDLWEIELDTKNTITEVPYLEIVNDVMKNNLKALMGEDALEQLAKAIFPFNLPYNAHLDRIRTYLNHFNLDLVTLYKAYEVDEKSIAIEQLGMSPEEHLMIITADITPKALQNAYGYNVYEITRMSNTEFSNHTGISLEEGAELTRLFKNPRGFFARVDLTLQIPYVAFDKLHRFIRLAKKLQWSLTDLNWTLISINANELNDKVIIDLGKIKILKDRFNLSIEELTCFWYPMKVSRLSDTAEATSMFDKTFNANEPFFLSIDKYGVPESEIGIPGQINGAYRWYPNDSNDSGNSAVRSHLCRALKLSNKELSLLCPDPKNTGFSLNINQLTEWYRKSKLSKLLSIPLYDTLKLLELEDNKLNTIDDLLKVIERADWLKEVALTVSELEYITAKSRTEKLVLSFSIKNIEPLLEVVKGFEDWHINTEKLVALIGDSLLSPLRKKEANEYIQMLLTNGIIDEKGTVISLDFKGEGSLIDKILSSLKIGDSLLSLLREKEANENSQRLLDKGIIDEKGTVIPSDFTKESSFMREIQTNHLTLRNYAGQSFLIQLAALLKLDVTFINAALNTPSSQNFQDFYAVLDNVKLQDNPLDALGQFVEGLIRFFFLVDKLKLTTSEIKCIMHREFIFIEGLENLTIDAFKTLHTFKKLSLKWPDEKNTFLQFCTGTIDEAKLYKVTGWNKDQYTLCTEIADQSNKIAKLALAQNRFDLADRLGIDITALEKLSCLVGSVLSETITYQKVVNKVGIGWQEIGVDIYRQLVKDNKTKLTFLATDATGINLFAVVYDYNLKQQLWFWSQDYGDTWNQEEYDSEWASFTQNPQGGFIASFQYATFHVPSDNMNSHHIRDNFPMEGKIFYNNGRYKFLISPIDSRLLFTEVYAPYTDTLIFQSERNGLTYSPFTDQSWNLGFDHRLWSVVASSRDAEFLVIADTNKQVAISGRSENPIRWDYNHNNNWDQIIKQSTAIKKALFGEFQVSNDNQFIFANFFKQTEDPIFRRDKLENNGYLVYGEIFRCNINENVWEFAGNGLPPDIGCSTFNLSPNGEILYAATYDCKIYYSHYVNGDNLEWKPLNPNLNLEGSSNDEVYVTSLTVSPDGLFLFVKTIQNYIFRLYLGVIPIQNQVEVEEILFHSIKSMYPEQEKWEKAYAPIRNHLNERERDALVGLLMHKLGNKEDSKNYFNNMDSPQDLSDFLLIDVEMSGVAKISKVKQGINTLQRYIQRCHMGLEKGGEITCTVADSEWQWRSHYRLWEANRKVFLYPENYIDPGLRKIKTPLFKKLEEELLQGDVTNETVTNAYLNYFDKLEELANLETVDSCGEKVITTNAPDGVETQFFIGKSSGATPKYFYRSVSIIDKKPATWSPWQEIHLSITGENVICHFSNDRLYLYWTEKNKITERKEGSGAPINSTFVTIKYSYQNVSGSWLAPIVLEKKLLPEVLNHECYWFELNKNSSNEEDFQDGLILKWNKDYDLELYTARRLLNIDYQIFIIFSKYAKIFCDDRYGGVVVEFTNLDHFNYSHWINQDVFNYILSAQSTYHAFNPDFEEKNKYDAKKGFFSQFTSHIVQKGVDGFLMDKHLQALLLALPGQDIPEENKDFVDSYSVYFREIFFHIPFLVADTLNHNQQFKDSQKWYHYIFNPIAHEDSTKMSENSVWNYHPFKKHSIETFDAMLKNNDELAIYINDPFDPHAIAGVRLGAYEKAIVMKYIDNLLDWGDQLYAQDNWESIVQAMLLYVLAQDLLGKRPRQAKQNYIQEPVQTFPPKGNGDAEVSHSLTVTFNSSDANYFPIPANMSFAGYWDRADDRLFKIRHSMNIKGIVRQMALFQPAIDPSQLMRALASGGDIASITNQLSAAVPHYRFSVMIQHAKSLTSTLSQLGSALLSAFEKKDAEQLNLLRSTQEKATLNLTTKIKEKQIEDAGKSLDSLNASLGSATSRKKHYEATISKGLITQEETSLSLTESALQLHTAAHQLRGAAVAAHLIPTVFGFADGSFQPGASVSEAATLLDAIAGIDSERAGLASIQGQNKRRVEDWALQLALATYDVTQIEAQIEGAQIKLEISQKDLDMHQQSIAQAKEREEMLRGKFSNQDLYQWMVGQVSSVYFQTYKMAFDMAKSAEKAYQYERNTEDTIITSSYWNSLKHGLMAGESLMLGLNQLEKTYLDEDERALEIEKTISLLNLYKHGLTEQDKNLLTDKDPKQVLDKLIVKDFQKKLKDGKYTFHLTEQLFNEDFPSHYCRKIKSISITIPAVVGPYQNLPATLTQTSNRILLTNDPDGREFLKKGKTGSDKNVRSDWRKQQKIAISKAVNDSGLFELNFHDERYLPFEGTGAVSDWELEMCGSNKDVLDTVSDVIIHIKYTALDGGETFKSKVLAQQLV